MAPKIPKPAAYQTKPFTIAPDVRGASLGFRPGYGYYTKVPGQAPPPPTYPRQAQAPQKTVRTVTSRTSASLNPIAALMQQYFGRQSAMPSPVSQVNASIAAQTAAIKAAYAQQQRDLANQ